MWRDRCSILERDPRFAYMVSGVDPVLGIIPVTIDHMYADIEPFALGAAVPEEIRRLFDIGRNAYVYSWFEYGLMTLAEMQAFAAFEMAIKSRAKIENSGLKPKPSLKTAIHHARANGWLRDEDFGFTGNPLQSMPVLDALVVQRNHIMHGNEHLYQHGTLIAFDVCSRAINRLFPSAS